MLYTALYTHISHHINIEYYFEIHTISKHFCLCPSLRSRRQSGSIGRYLWNGSKHINQQIVCCYVIS